MLSIWITCTPPEQGGGEGPGQTSVAQDLAFVERGAVLADFVTDSAAARIEADVGPLPQGPIEPPDPNPHTGLGGGDGGDGGDGGGCAHCATNPDASNLGAGLGLGLLALLGGLGLRRRRSRDAGA